MNELDIEENVKNIYDYPFNDLKTSKKYAPIIVSILTNLKEGIEPISIQSALDILDDSKTIIKQITQV